MFRLFFYPVFDSYLLVAAVALLLAGLMWFGPSREKTGRGRRAVIALLRAAVIALVLLAMLRPTLVYTHTEKQAATLVVLVDQSRSMTVPDAVGNKTRWDALRLALADAAPALAKLQREFELKAYTFDADVHEVRAERGKIELPDKPEGQQTAIGAALDEVLRREAGKRLLGVVLLSDGAQRAYAPRDLPPQTAAARLQTARLSDVHAPLRPVARAGRGPRRGRQGPRGQSQRVRQERTGHHRQRPRRRLRQRRYSRARAVRDFARQDGSRRRAEDPRRRRRPTPADQAQLHPAKCPANTSSRSKPSPSPANW